MKNQLKMHKFERVDTERMGAYAIENAYLYRRLLVVFEPDTYNVHVTTPRGLTHPVELLDVQLDSTGSPSAATLQVLQPILDNLAMLSPEYDSFEAGHGALLTMFLSEEPMT